jgi:phosphoglycerate dehydrogenase-like enzyme
MDRPNTPLDVLITLPLADPLVNQLREISPRLRITIHPARKAEDIPAEQWARCEVLYTNRILPAPGQAPKLRWIQFHFSGIDEHVDNPIVQDPEIIATTLSGATVPQIGEYAVMMLLALGHRMTELAANQAKAEWPRDRIERFMPRELRGSTVGIAGYGSIGRQIARLLQPFGVSILAVKRDVMHPEDTGYTPDGLGDPGGDFFQRLYPVQAIGSMLRECDYLVVTLPRTPETQGLIGAAELAALKPGAALVDFSHGGVVDQAALIQALQDRRLSGAALDVFPEEPLPANSPLWKMSNVIISPHIAGNSPSYNERAVELFAENLHRFLAGLPLYNRFDPQKGY